MPSVLFSVEGHLIQCGGHCSGNVHTLGATLRNMEDYPEYSQFDVIKILIDKYFGKICIQCK